jgi:K+-sensing histidine kinase KdpD
VRHHLLLVPAAAAVPSRILVCVSGGEHGKADVRFAERLAWQLGAAATVMTVLPHDNGRDEVPVHVERFMQACAHALCSRGVVARTRVRRGDVEQEVLLEMEEGRHDLLVIGAPHQTRSGRIVARSGIVQRFLADPPPCPLLLVRR